MPAMVSQEATAVKGREQAGGYPFVAGGPAQHLLPTCSDRWPTCSEVRRFLSYWARQAAQARHSVRVSIPHWRTDVRGTPGVVSSYETPIFMIIGSAGASLEGHR